ncbi:MAG TPA: hypothetical protein VIN57_06640 [Magnetovibrio sp.]
MKAGRETADFLFEVEHVGLDVDFYHPQGRNLKLSEAVIESFEAQREDAEIFVQNSSGTGFSCDEMLSWFLLQTRTTLAQHLPPRALEPGHGHVMLTVPVRFEPDTFHMDTEAGDVDLSALKLMCKVTVVPRNG